MLQNYAVVEKQSCEIEIIGTFRAKLLPTLNHSCEFVSIRRNRCKHNQSNKEDIVDKDA
jgi:hypothetical protein